MPKQRTNRNIARIALTGAAIAAPLAITVPANAAPESTWDAVAECEGSGDWNTDTGNGYSGGLQFDDQTWSGYGGTEFADNAADATREEQIAVGERVLEAQGPSAWPNCGPSAGLTAGGEAEHQDVESGDTEEDADEDSVADESVAEEPAEEEPVEEPVEPQVETEQQPVEQDDGDHTVQAGETLSGIAEQYGVDMQGVFEQNRDVLDNPDLIITGQQLAVN